MKTARIITTIGIALLWASLASSASAQVAPFGQDSRSKGDRKAQRQQEQSCQPGIENAVRKNALHRDLYVELEPSTEDLASLLGAVTDQTTYAWRGSLAQVVSQVLNCRPMDGTSPLCGMC